MMGRSKSTDKVRRAMAMVHPNAAAIDVGATMHVAAVRADRTPEPVRSFGTFTKDLHRLVDWFAECGVDTVVMESTSVYWIPIFELLDARGFAVFLVNARDAKHVPGRKTDVSDAEWLQRLHSYGLLRASFRPKGRIVELRAYLRQRERLLEYGASHIQHMQKALTEMNVQLHHVVTDITGATGLRIVRAILAGERDPAVLARLRDSRCHATVETIEKALTGTYSRLHDGLDKIEAEPLHPPFLVARSLRSIYSQTNARGPGPTFTRGISIGPVPVSGPGCGPSGEQEHQRGEN